MAAVPGASPLCDVLTDNRIAPELRNLCELLDDRGNVQNVSANLLTLAWRMAYDRLLDAIIGHAGVNKHHRRSFG